MVEVTHESLFRVWPELASWLDESRELMLWKKNIQDEMKDWFAHDHSPLYLLSGAHVVEGRRWLASNADDFADAESEFITASIADEDARIARERAQQEKLRWLARLLAVAAVASSLIGVYAFHQRNEADAKARAALESEARERSQRLVAEGQTRIATSRQLAALSSSKRDKRFDLSLLLAVEASGPRILSKLEIVSSKLFKIDLASRIFCMWGKVGSRAWPSAPTEKPSQSDTRPTTRNVAEWYFGMWPHANA